MFDGDYRGSLRDFAPTQASGFIIIDSFITMENDVSSVMSIPGSKSCMAERLRVYPTLLCNGKSKLCCGELHKRMMLMVLTLALAEQKEYS